jgi:hypothetical protein
VAESAFTQAFLHRAIEIEKSASTTELELLDRTLAYVSDDPSLPGRFRAFMIHNIQPSFSGLARSLSSLP